MGKDTIYVALDDGKPKIVAGILRPGAEHPELREIANDLRPILRLFERVVMSGVAAEEASR